MNTRGRIIQVINFHGGKYDLPFSEKINNVKNLVNKRDRKEFEDFLLNVVNNPSKNYVTKIELSYLSQFLSNDVLNSFTYCGDRSDFYHLQGLDSPRDRLTKEVNLVINQGRLLKLFHQGTIRGYLKGTFELTSDQYKIICDEFNLNFEYIMTGNESKLKVQLDDELSGLLDRMKKCNFTPSSLGKMTGYSTISKLFYGNYNKKTEKETRDKTIKYVKNKLDLYESGRDLLSIKERYSRSLRFIEIFKDLKIEILELIGLDNSKKLTEKLYNGNIRIYNSGDIQIVIESYYNRIDIVKIHEDNDYVLMSFNYNFLNNPKKDRIIYINSRVSEYRRKYDMNWMMNEVIDRFDKTMKEFLSTLDEESANKLKDSILNGEIFNRE